MKNLQKVMAISLFPLLMSHVCQAQNPIVQTWFTPDPAPMVHNDTVYLFTDHDEDDAQYFKMKDWQLYSTTDMVNWTYRGTPISTETFQWAMQGDNAWASQAIERDGKWYWYICANDTIKKAAWYRCGRSRQTRRTLLRSFEKASCPRSFRLYRPLCIH